ncbi:MAG: FecR domain-containing protein [Limisphaerales bacterium]
MKRTQIIIACALALILAGATTLRSAEEGIKQAKATVRACHGKVDYQDTQNGPWLPVKPNMKFSAGITLRTGPDGAADISVNGNSSAVRMTNNTILQIPTMSYVGSAREGDTTTMLNLETGTVIGNVKKISANSRYEIMTPHGVAGIRGTDFAVECVRMDNHTFDVTFNSITGVITVSAVINGQTVTHTLTTGQSWEIGKDVKQMKMDILIFFQQQINFLIQQMLPPPPPPGPRGPNPVFPFPGGPPQGPQPSL